MTSVHNKPGSSTASRESLVNIPACLAGATIASNAISDFPTIWAQAITVQMQASANTDLRNRFQSKPSANVGVLYRRDLKKPATSVTAARYSGVEAILQYGIRYCMKTAT